MEQGYIFIHNSIFPSLLAISGEEQSRGLMYIDPPAPVMTFVYDKPRINKFWMANTQAPLDILFCHEGKVSEVCYGEPHSTSVIGSNLFSDLVIELPHGTVESAKIKIGQPVGLVKPTPDELHRIIAEKYHLFVKF
jgi:uncharacterized membrane protein (UPF0127 family)